MASHRYWRIRSDDTYVGGDFLGIAELQMRDSIGGADLTAGRTAFASAEFHSFVAGNAIDDNAGSFWTTGSASPPPGGHWLAVDFGIGNAVELAQIVLAVRPDSFREDPADLFIEASDDSSSWEVVWSHPSIPAWTAGEMRSFAAPSITRARLTSLTAEVIHPATPALRLSQAAAAAVHPGQPIARMTSFGAAISNPGRPGARSSLFAASILCSLDQVAARRRELVIVNEF